MGPLQCDPASSWGTQTAKFEILQNRVPYVNFQKTNNDIFIGLISYFFMFLILEDITQ